eukprot:gene34292-43988_t
MKLSIGHKLSAASLIFVLAMGGLLVGAWGSLSHLRKLQDGGMDLVRTASAAQALSGQGAALYQVIADAEINHELSATQTDWAAEKARTEAMYKTLGEQLTEADDKALLAQSYTGYQAYVALFEQKMMPALQVNAEM